MTGHTWLALFNEAKTKFGAPGGWNQFEVARWLKGRVDGLYGPDPALQLVAEPEPEPPSVEELITRWKAFDRL